MCQKLGKRKKKLRAEAQERLVQRTLSRLRGGQQTPTTTQFNMKYGFKTTNARIMNGSVTNARIYDSTV